MKRFGMGGGALLVIVRRKVCTRTLTCGEAHADVVLRVTCSVHDGAWSADGEDLRRAADVEAPAGQGGQSAAQFRGVHPTYVLF
jgi:hypothetical protein